MPLTKRYAIFLTALILIAASCSLPSRTASAPRATITAIPTNTPVLITPTPPAPQVTEIIAPTATPEDDSPLYTLTPGEGLTYFENFQRDEVPFWIFADDIAYTFLDEGDLYFHLIDPGMTFVFPLHFLPPETNTLDMWAKIPQASGEAAFGLSCRVTPGEVTESGYHFAVHLDGKYTVFAFTPEGSVILKEGLITDPDFDLTNWTFFHLECDGERFYFTVSGIPLYTTPITEPVYQEGSFGIVGWGRNADPYDEFAIQVFSASGP